MEEHAQASGSEKLLSELGIGATRDQHPSEWLGLFKREKIFLDRWMICGQPPRFIDRVAGLAQIVHWGMFWKACSAASIWP